MGGKRGIVDSGADRHDGPQPDGQRLADVQGRGLTNGHGGDGKRPNSVCNVNHRLQLQHDRARATTRVQTELQESAQEHASFICLVFALWWGRARAILGRW